MSDYILALETSQTICGASVYKNKKEFSESILNKDRSHASMVTAVIDSAMKQLGKDFQDISAIAVSAGPGSFTGLRIGLTVAKAMAFAREIPLIMVPTHAVIAMEIVDMLPGLERFIIAQKANMTEFYVSVFTNNGDGLTGEFENKVYSEAQLQDCLHEGRTLVSPQNWFAVEKYVNLSSPKPCIIAEWALQHGTRIPWTEIDEVEPLYLKDFVIKRKAQ